MNYDGKTNVPSDNRGEIARLINELEEKSAKMQAISQELFLRVDHISMHPSEKLANPTEAREIYTDVGNILAEIIGRVEATSQTMLNVIENIQI